MISVGLRADGIPGRDRDSLLRFGCMTTPRFWFVNALLVSILAGSLVSIVTRNEYWPFSPYPMFAHRHRVPLLTRRRLYGVTDAAAGREIPLRDFAYLQPLDVSRLGVGLERLDRGRAPNERLHRAIGDCLRRYEKRRVAGRHDGPPLQGIRLYRVTWKLDPEVRNLDHPDRRILVDTVWMPGYGN